jgi:hypothetical protein
VTATGRVVAVIAGLVGLLFAAADLVREAVLASERSVAWPFAEWWSQLTADPTWATAVAAAAATVVTVALILLAVRQLRPQRRGPELVEFGDAASRAQLDVPALERALRRRLENDLPGVKTRGLELTKRGDGWCVRLEADLPARDVLGVQARAGGLLVADLARMGGLQLDGLDVVVTRLT